MQRGDGDDEEVWSKANNLDINSSEEVEFLDR